MKRQLLIISTLLLVLFVGGLTSTRTLQAQSGTPDLSATSDVTATSIIVPTTDATSTPDVTSTPDTSAASTVQTGPLLMGRVRFIHASQGTPNLDVYLDGLHTPALTNMAYGTSTGFMPLVPATHHIVIRPTGAPTNIEPLFQRDFILSSGNSLNIVAIGLLSRQGSRGFLLLLIPANFWPAGSQARIQVIHASPDAGAVDILVNNYVAEDHLMYGDGLFTGITVNAGTSNVSVVPTGKFTPLYVNAPNMGLAANTLYTIVMAGTVDKLQSLVLVDPIVPITQLAPTPTS